MLTLRGVQHKFNSFLGFAALINKVDLNLDETALSMPWQDHSPPISNMHIAHVFL